MTVKILRRGQEFAVDNNVECVDRGDYVVVRSLDYHLNIRVLHKACYTVVTS